MKFIYTYKDFFKERMRRTANRKPKITSNIDFEVGQFKLSKFS